MKKKIIINPYSIVFNFIITVLEIERPNWLFPGHWVFH